MVDRVDAAEVTTGLWRERAGTAARYGIAATGPVGAAAAQFVLSMQLLHVLPPAAFGAFAFLLVTSQFSAGIWSALFCAPLPSLLSEVQGDARETMLRTMFSTNLALVAAAFLAFAGLGLSLGVGWLAAALFGAYAALALVRWFARAYAYSTSAPLRTTASDLLYCACLLSGIALIWFAGERGLVGPFAVLAASIAVGLLPFGRDFLARQFVRISPRAVRGYAPIWRRHSRWSLAGVVTTEATGNAHAYVVTAIAGAALFAPIAASALLIRPIAVVLNALTDFERPQMARFITQGRIDACVRSKRAFRIVLLLAWFATALAAAALLGFWPHLLFPAQYPRDELIAGAALWMAVAGVRMMRSPESVLLQAAGAFRWLAFASFGSSVVSVAAVVGLVLVAGPLWSIGGVLLGEIIFAASTWRQAARLEATWTSEQDGGPPAGERS